MNQSILNTRLGFGLEIKVLILILVLKKSLHYITGCYDPVLQRGVNTDQPVYTVSFTVLQQVVCLLLHVSNMFDIYNRTFNRTYNTHEVYTAKQSVLIPPLDLGVTRPSFCGSTRKFCGWLAGSSRKIRLRFSNVSSIGLSVRSSCC